MRVYTVSDPGGVDPSVWWRRVARCWAAGLLTDADIVWGRPGHPLPVLQVLRAGQAEAWWLLEPDVAGYVRLGKGRARWAPTYDGTRDAPSATLDYAAIPGGVAASRVVVVVAHRHRTASVGVVARSQRQPMAGGVARCPVTGARVVDLAAYQPPAAASVPAASVFEAAAAVALGQDLLLDGLPAADRARIASLELAVLDVPPESWRAIIAADLEIAGWAEQVAAATTAALLRGPHSAA